MFNFMSYGSSKKKKKLLKMVKIWNTRSIIHWRTHAWIIEKEVFTYLLNKLSLNDSCQNL
jgi:hypothetical protein